MSNAHQLSCRNASQHLCPYIVCRIGLMNIMITAVFIRDKAFLINKVTGNIYERNVQFIADLGDSTVEQKKICIVELWLLASLVHIHCADKIELDVRILGIDP